MKPHLFWRPLVIILNFLPYAPNYAINEFQDPRMTLFFALDRDLSDERLCELMNRIIGDANDDPDIIADLFLIAFQTRHRREEKGGRDFLN